MSEQKKITEKRRTDNNQMSLITLSNDEVIEIIRPEANLEKWSSFLFPPTKGSQLKDKRVKEWNITLPDGRKGRGAIEIDPPSSGHAYTYRTYDVFLALIAIWNEQDQPITFNTSLRAIARKMEVPGNGKWVKIIYEELECLKKTTLSWILSYKSSEKERQNISHQHILATFEYYGLNERESLETRFEGLCRLGFDEKIYQNLVNRTTIPKNWTARKSISSPTARVLYNLLDTILYKNNIHERKALNLVEDLCLTPHRYKYKSQRKVLVEMLQKQLNGKRLSDFRIIIVEVRETADGQDWKCVFLAQKDHSIIPAKKHNLKKKNTDKDFIEYLIGEIGDVVGDTEQNHDLYRTFAMYYSQTLIFRALSEFKELMQNNPKIKEFKQRYFTSHMHTVAHKMGSEWIKPCDKNCKYRPENTLFS